MGLYISGSLAENEAFVRSLARIVLEKGKTCCICGEENCGIWIFDGAFVANGCVIFARLFCKEHEKRWKKGEMLNYMKFNGVLLLKMPHQKPVGMWINMSWNDFVELVEAHTKDDRYEARFIFEDESSFGEYLTKNAHLIFKGKIEEFLKQGTRSRPHARNP